NCSHTVHIAQHVVFEDVGHHRVPDGAHERITAESRTVVARLEYGGRVFGEHGADWHPATETLGRGHRVRVPPPAPQAPQGAEPSDASLHFIQDEQQALVATEVANVAQVALGGDMHTALTLDRLEEDARGRLVDGTLQRVHIVERDLDETVGQRCEAA